LNLVRPPSTAILLPSPYPPRSWSGLTNPGTPKTFTKTADSGKTIVSYFCPDCGTTVYRTGDSFGTATVVKAGVIDDKEWATKNVPKAELYTTSRVAWAAPVEGAAQLPGMM
jgi:hypothetical protein